jgi:hypothetical protein
MSPRLEIIITDPDVAVKRVVICFAYLLGLVGGSEYRFK